MSGESKPLWMQHGGWYRPILDLSTPWVGSPELDKPKTAPYVYIAPFMVSETQQHRPTPKSEKSASLPSRQSSRQSKRKRLVISRVLHRLADKIGRIPEDDTLVSRPKNKADLRADEVALREWKAWGYYAYPKLHGQHIKNFPPHIDVPPNIDVEEVFRNLKDERQAVRPERWIRGLQHPALPPRPARWRDHPKGAPLPFPWTCQLNPFLQHVTLGRPPLDWDISEPSAECYMGQTDVLIPLTKADKAQPATYPFVTHMYINAIAEDPYPEHFWPFYVVNENGVTVKDVLDKVYENFQQYLSVVEFQSWKGHYHRQNAARIAFEMAPNDADLVRATLCGVLSRISLALDLTLSSFPIESTGAIFWLTAGQTLISSSHGAPSIFQHAHFAFIYYVQGNRNAWTPHIARNLIYPHRYVSHVYRHCITSSIVHSSLYFHG
ncbi:hypothetical protein LshimejAT787_1104800 [Lyophyllum shimeji]|uniref:DUF6699 domain-containing protein n=1 Tax=Lyophyllum shimeji TaxID=47721 RepID=A0A9P3PTC8_LYOSH|nr:hypothetical protein LshimejAT787_1104800 [Lyophyllum shimeji]